MKKCAHTQNSSSLAALALFSEGAADISSPQGVCEEVPLKTPDTTYNISLQSLFPEDQYHKGTYNRLLQFPPLELTNKKENSAFILFLVI